MADDVSGLLDEEKETGKTVKSQLDDFIELAKENGIDFWAIVKSSCTPYEHDRLLCLYEGKSLEELDAKTFKKPEEKPEEEIFPTRDGKTLISTKQAKELYAIKGLLDAEHYYVEHKNNQHRKDLGNALLISKRQKEFMKDNEMYIYYAAIPQDDFIKRFYNLFTA
ncbi:MAG TPA: hypothetical protein VNX68_02860 [Nitrosopumilaceae archaeon]|nr:hypothetical protein [Nitrosopumilaceae archaeon]